MKRIISILLLMAILLSAFSIPAFADGEDDDDNAQSGSGNTHQAGKGYGWYNGYQYLWKVTLFVGKSDQASKQDNLKEDFHRIGTVVMKKTGWTVSSSVKFANGTKVDYYDGTAMAMDTKPYIISDKNCPAVPIACDGGDIDTVKAYFGSTGTLSTVLNGIADDKGTTKEAMLSELSFTIGGRTKKGWAYEYVDPNGTSNRVPWVIVYEPMVIMNLKDNTTKLAFTATEFALCELNGWYDWDKSGGSGQNVAILTNRHLPTSVQLEESWFGYPVYAVTNDSQKWDYEDVVKGGGWGMRWLSPAIKEPQAAEIDFGCCFTSVSTSPVVGGYGTVRVSWINYKAESGTVLCTIYRGNKLVFSEWKTIEGGEEITTSLSLYYSTAGTETLTCYINWEHRNDETDPDDNMDEINVTARNTTVPPSLDYGVYFAEVEQPEQDDYGSVTVRWRNWTGKGGTVLCELYCGGEIIWSGYKTFTAYQAIESTYEVFYRGYSTRTLEARINYAYKDTEKDSSDNRAVRTVTPTRLMDDTYDFSVSDLTVSPITVYQGRSCTVSFISDNWNHDVAYEDILVEVLVGNTVVKSEYVDFRAFGRNRHTYTINMTNLGNQTITARINWARRNYEDNRDNNSVSKTVSVQKYYDFSVSNLKVEPNICYEDETVNITFRTDSWDSYNSYINVPVDIMYNGSVLYTEYVNYAPFGGKNHSITINVGKTIGVNEIAVRINWAKRNQEVRTGNNITDTVQLTVKERKDLTIEAITPNSPYRAGMTVITSYNIINSRGSHVLPEHNNTVSFEAYYYNGSTKVVISSQVWEQAVIPANEKNLVYFKWTVPANIEGKTVYCKATVNSDLTIEEQITNNNTDTLVQTVAGKLYSQTPDTQFEKTKPNGWTAPVTARPNGGVATWSMWVYENGAFVRRGYGISIATTSPTAQPDEGSPSAKYVNGYWQMRSGYGFYLSYRPTITRTGSEIMPDSSAYTEVQQVYATFPEFKYLQDINSFRTLEKVNGAWMFEQNPYADGKERLHFTPLWYPNGDYTVSVIASEVWTPAGMIQAVRNCNTIRIVDSAYDDWYVGEE